LVPDPAHEAIRDLVRATSVGGAHPASGQSSGFLLRHGYHYHRPAWTLLHRRWLATLKFDQALHHIVLEDCIAAIAKLSRIARLGAPPAGEILGAAHVDQPREAVAAPGQTPGRVRIARAGLRLVHRRLRHQGSGGPEGSACRVRVNGDFPTHALTPQAKGRVERANQTLQDRLVKEMRLRAIDTMEAANALSPVFIALWNEKFAVPPRDATSAHRPWTQTSEAWTTRWPGGRSGFYPRR
jgi:hypothetical protein